MTNIDEVCSAIMSEDVGDFTTDKGDDKVFGLFSQKELEMLREEFLTTSNTHKAVLDILKPIFGKFGIRCFDELPSVDDEEAIKLRHEIQTIFYNVQRLVLVEKKLEPTEEILHMKGDPIRDEHGNPKIDPLNDKKVLLYKRTEYKKQVVMTPIYNPSRDYGVLDRLLGESIIGTNFKELRSRLLDESKLSYERGCEIIRELTNYYAFEDTDKFVDRFALLICNAKAKGLGIHPKFPVLFSLVGEQNKGKGWFSKMIRDTYDKLFLTRSQKTSIGNILSDNRFNGVMMTRGFIAFDEKEGADSAKCEKLKTLITEPEVSIELKHKEARTVRNLVTFFSTTNEKIKGIMGLQKDRRIVEFVLKEKVKEMPEELMTKLLTELWEVMPAYHPHPDKIISELLYESEQVLDTTMEQIVAELFKNHKIGMLSSLQFEFCRNNNFIKTPYFKNCIKDLKYGRHEAIWDWMENKHLFKVYANGTVRINQYEVEQLLTKMYPEEFLPLMSAKQEIQIEIPEDLKVELNALIEKYPDVQWCELNLKSIMEKEDM